MRHFFVSVFIINCFVIAVSSIDSKPSENNTSGGCFEYLIREHCLKEASATASNCRLIHGQIYQTSEAKKCDELEQNLNSQCAAKCAKASCVDCITKTEIAVKSCKQFANKVNCNYSVPAKECNEMERSMVNYCIRKKCEVCKDLYCRNGGKCAMSTFAFCSCPPGYGGAFCQKGLCVERPCMNGGSCIGANKCKCLPAFSGEQCGRKRLGTKENPAPNAQAILDAGDSLGSGLYWIQPPGESSPAQTYCDMNFDDGAWMLASYGYVHKHTTGTNSNNHGIPNMNNLFGFNWRPSQRASSNGVINLPEGAVKMAKNALYMIMAAGKNPITGGIDSYSHVYRIYLKNNPYQITFKNHNRYNGAQSGMHVTDFLVEALKGESGTYLRFALGEALGVTWSDSFPTGYGFNDKTVPFASFSKGPFFPSVLSGSGRSPCGGCTPTNYEPDVVGGSPHYTHRGWYTANGMDKTGQTSIWFK